MTTTTEMMRALKDQVPSSEDVLHALGLQYERSASTSVATLTAFAVGAVAGAVLATFLSPKSGAEMRQGLNERVRAFGDRMGFSEGSDEQPSQH
jgi:hypothetical protein